MRTHDKRTTEIATKHDTPLIPADMSRHDNSSSPSRRVAFRYLCAMCCAASLVVVTIVCGRRNVMQKSMSDGAGCTENAYTDCFVHFWHTYHCYVYDIHVRAHALHAACTTWAAKQFALRGVRGCVVITLVTILAACAVALPDSLQRWPHPLMWRLLAGCGFVYVGLILYSLLFHDVQTTKRLLTYYDASLTQPLPERAYAEDCQLVQFDFPYLRLSHFNDVFILAHAVGYVLKTLIVRDWRMATCLSLSFELVELSLQHILPNFRECWWDHLLLDVLLCNAAGTAMGMWLLRRCGAMRFDWITWVNTVSSSDSSSKQEICDCTLCATESSPAGTRVLQSDSAEAQARIVLHPAASPQKTRVCGTLNVFLSARQLMEVCSMLLFMLLQELNCFTMKAILNIPVTHHLVSGRLLLWFFLALPGMREYYVHFRCPASSSSSSSIGSCGPSVSNHRARGGERHRHDARSTPPRLGVMAWLTTVGLLLETAWIVKMAVQGGYFRQRTPNHVLLPCMAAGVSFIVWFVLHFFVLSRVALCGLKKCLCRMTNALFYLGCCSILAMTMMSMPDLQIGRHAFEQAAESISLEPLLRLRSSLAQVATRTAYRV